MKQCAMQSGEQRKRTKLFFPWSTEIKYHITSLSRTLPSLDLSGFLCAMRNLLDALENSSRVNVAEKMENKLE